MASKRSSSKITSKNNKKRISKLFSIFNPRSPKGGMALFALIFALAGGGYFAYKSFAITNTFYYYQSSDGIRHSTGRVLATQNFDIGSLRSWLVHSGDINGRYMWYGPYKNYSLSPGINYYIFCFAYVSNNPWGKNKVLFDVTYNNGSGRRVLTSQTVELNQEPYSSGTRKTSSKCLEVSRSTASSTLKSIELRVKPVSIPVPENESPEQAKIIIIRTSVSQY
ncbi:MAG: hypothetical protein AAB459_02445 [Patescibacteria group bacterium]|mgnify:CR=1 FL=1